MAFAFPWSPFTHFHDKGCFGYAFMHIQPARRHYGVKAFQNTDILVTAARYVADAAWCACLYQHIAQDIGQKPPDTVNFNRNGGQIELFRDFGDLPCLLASFIEIIIFIHAEIGDVV